MHYKVLLSLSFLLISSVNAATFTYLSNGGFIKKKEEGTKAQIFLDSVNFDNPVTISGYTETYGKISWGEPSPDMTGHQSSLITTEQTGQAESTGPGEALKWYKMGNLEHHNFSLQSRTGTLIFTQMVWDFKLENSNNSVFHKSLAFDLYNWETDNIGTAACPRETVGAISYNFGKKLSNGKESFMFEGDGNSITHCDDAHEFVSTFDLNQTFTSNGIKYMVLFSGFYNEDDELTHTFWTPEEQISSLAYIKFAIVEQATNYMQIGGNLWLDIDPQDGLQNEPISLNNIPIFKVLLLKCQDVQLCNNPTIIQETYSTKRGDYIFSKVKAFDIGTQGKNFYKVHFDIPSAITDSFIYTTPHVGNDKTIDSDVNNTIDLGTSINSYSIDDANSTRLNVDAGIVFGSISGQVWEDANKDGIRQETEKTIDSFDIGSLTVNLYKDGSAIIEKSIQTQPNGTYIFAPLPSGEYVVEVIKPSINTDINFTSKQQGSDPKIDSDVNEFNGQSDKLIINLKNNSAKHHFVHIDAGLYGNLITMPPRPDPVPPPCGCDEYESKNASALSNLTILLMIILTIYLVSYFEARRKQS